MDTINYCKLSTYCTLSNFIEATETISEDLAVVGLPPVTKYDEKDPPQTVVSLINTIWTLLQHRQRLVDGKRNLDHKLSSEKQRQLESTLHCNEDNLMDNKRLLFIKTQEESESAKKIKSLKQEVQELRQQLKSKEWQFKHDYKRQQNEVALLQSKLRGILSKEKGDKWKGPTDSSIERKSICRNEDLLKKCITRLESNIQKLVKENLELRKLLDNVSEELAEMLLKKNQNVEIT